MKQHFGLNPFSFRAGVLLADCAAYLTELCLNPFSFRAGVLHGAGAQ